MRSALSPNPRHPVATALRRFLESAGYEVIVGEHARRRRSARCATARRTVLLDLAVSRAGRRGAVPGGEAGGARELPVLLLYMPEEENPEERATAAGADACLVGPLKRTTLVTCVGLMLQLVEATAAARFPARPPAPPRLPEAESDDAAARRLGWRARPLRTSTSSSGCC